MGSGFIPPGTVIPPSVSPPDIWAVKVKDYTPESTRTYKDMLTDIAPAVAKRQAGYAAACEDEQQLGTGVQQLDADIKDRQQRCAKLRVDFIRERMATGSACDAHALGIRLQALDAEVAFLCDCRDMVFHVQLPAAQRARLESFLALQEVIEARAGIEYAWKRSELLDKLIVSGVYVDNGPRIGLYSEELERLQTAREHAARAVDDAKRELRELITRQESMRQKRLADGQTTKAELAARLAGTLSQVQ